MKANVWSDRQARYKTTRFWNMERLGPTRARRAKLRWPALRAEYSWHPPFEGEAATEPNRVEIVFSSHGDVVLSQDGRQYELNVRAGAMYVVGDPATKLQRVREPSDTLEMFLGQSFVDAAAQDCSFNGNLFQPTLGSSAKVELPYHASVLGLAHILRSACVGARTLSDVEASAIATKLLEVIGGPKLAHDQASRRRERIDAKTLARVADFIEAELGNAIDVLDVAAVAGLSLFHFTRAFRNSVGMPPHKFVLSRRMERAKSLLLNSDESVQDIAWSLGFENLSHFRRKFYGQFGVTPGRLRELE